AAALSLMPGPEEKSPGWPGALSLRERRALEAGAATVIRGFDVSFRERVGAVAIARRWKRERAEAARLWERLRKEPREKRRLLVEQVARFQTWAMCERLCDESVRAAAHDAGEARKLADLALFAAEKAPGREIWRRRLQGYAWAFVGNAWRVAGNLREAETAFQSALKLWIVEEVSGPLDGTRILEMLAILRLYQRQPTAALDLLDQA